MKDRTEHPKTRLGITVSRRAGNAAERNRAKRLIREAFRATRELWAPDLDVVVIARGPLGPLRLADVVGELRGAKQAIAAPGATKPVKTTKRSRIGWRKRDKRRTLARSHGSTRADPADPRVPSHDFPAARAGMPVRTLLFSVRR